MNNLQHIVKDNTRFAMHVAVELCEQGDFDSPYEAVQWLMQERDDSELGSGTCEDVSTKNGIFKCSECGCTVEEDGVDWGEIHYCSDCGKRVKR